LIIRLDPARSERTSWTESVEVSPAELGAPELTALSPVEVEGTLTPAPPDFVLEARLAFRVTIACDRCTRPVEMPVESELRLVVVPVAGPVRRRGERATDEVELRESDLGVVEVAGESLDTRPLVLEQVQLELPSRPLCRDDCAGLCPRCGADRNLGECACGPGEADPRWAGALAALKSKLDGDA
jgi:uncharacterized protein